MEEHEVRERLEAALVRLAETDLYLLEYDLSERCIAGRLAMYLQDVFPDHTVDIEGASAINCCYPTLISF